VKETLKVAILDMYNGAPNEGMRCIKTIAGRFLAQDGIVGQYDVFDVRQKNELPDLSYDIFISSGGPGDPVPCGEDWEKPFFEFLDQIWKYNIAAQKSEKKHLFLICHSFQMAAYHWNLGRVCKRKSTSFGIFPMSRTNAGVQETLFEDLPLRFYAVDSRDYQLIEPNQAALKKIGAKVLCIEKNRPHVNLERAIMAIRFSEQIFGTQFHPEADSEGMLRYFLKEEKKEAVVKIHGEKKYNDMVASLQDPDKIMLTESVILPSFLNHAAQQILDLTPTFA
jgi:homoserine O-succinyltransferase/O-acetyltransferase